MRQNPLGVAGRKPGRKLEDWNDGILEYWLKSEI